MAKIITFPKTHRDFVYHHEQCMNCKEYLSEFHIGTEVVGMHTKHIFYLCDKCSENRTSITLSYE